MKTVLALALGLAFATTATANCPPLATYQVSGVTMTDGTIRDAVGVLVEGTAWTSKVNGPADGVKVSLRNVAGPLDKVLTTVVERAGQSAPAGVGLVVDSVACAVVLTVRERPAPAVRLPDHTLIRDLRAAASDERVAVSHAPTGEYIVRAGQKVSEALEAYVQRHGWKLRWHLPDDYRLDVDVPVKGGVMEGVLTVIRAYQMAGAMQGVRPVFHESNKVVVIKKTGEVK